MKKIVTAFLASSLTYLSFGQTMENQKMIELGRTYKDFMFRKQPTKEIVDEVILNVPVSLKTAADFIVETITTKNKLLSNKYLTRPDNKILKQIFIIKAINLNLREENQIDNNKLIDSLSAKEISNYELVENYYEMFFTAVGNKNQPFDLSGVDFKMKEYNFKDDTEKGIMFLSCMDYCGKTIWGFMNIVKPANTAKAFDNIKKFPKFNGLPYFQYTDFYFKDFEMNILQNEGTQSYKSYYLDKYYEILLSHLTCLNQEGGTDTEKMDLLLGSILKDQNLYKYTTYKETLESIFKEYKKG